MFSIDAFRCYEFLTLFSTLCELATFLLADIIETNIMLSSKKKLLAVCEMTTLTIANMTLITFSNFKFILWRRSALDL